MTDVICKHCGLVNDYHIVEKSNNQCAYCNGCDSFVKNIPYDSPKLYFGKYKGQEIAHITDKQYLQWYLENIQKIPFTTQQAISLRISQL